MRLSTADALKILGLERPGLTQEAIKIKYRKLCSINHPDRNPDGLEAMKMINIAYDALREYKVRVEKPAKESKKKAEKEPKKQEKDKRTPEEINRDALRKYVDKMSLIRRATDAEDTIWILGETYDHREKLKSFKCRWCPDKRMWHYKKGYFK